MYSTKAPVPPLSNLRLRRTYLAWAPPPAPSILCLDGSLGLSHASQRSFAGGLISVHDVQTHPCIAEGSVIPLGLALDFSCSFTPHIVHFPEPDRLDAPHITHSQLSLRALSSPSTGPNLVAFGSLKYTETFVRVSFFCRPDLDLTAANTATRRTHSLDAVHVCHLRLEHRFSIGVYP